VTAFIHLGEVRMRQGDVMAAVATWERAIDVATRPSVIWRWTGSNARTKKLQAPSRFAETLAAA
jgi:hypothetical protein